MSGKSFFIDLTKCTACRGCQVACKQWHKHPAEETRNWGSHQNPKDLSFVTFKLVRFKEDVIDGKLNWLFFPDQCRHCMDPPCQYGASVKDSIVVDSRTGAVLFTKKTAQDDFESIWGSCPYNIPRKEKNGKLIAKCDMCIDRVRNGLQPACVQACPTGAMNFGDREDIMKMAEARLAVAKKKWPKAKLVDPEDVRVIVLAAFDPMDYYESLSADAGPILKSRRAMFAGLGRPFSRIVG
ncbi:MAG: 4Fe-4S dicluster domain-containing protein [Desulfovibrionaceae bacterium]